MILHGMCTYLLLRIYVLFTGGHEKSLSPTPSPKRARTGVPTVRPEGCRSSTRVPPPKKKDPIGSSSQQRTKVIASRKKGKSVADPPEQEVLPEDNVKTVLMHMWRAIRRNNPYRFEQRTYPGRDRRFWTKTQAIL
jgi:hypothetical protein